MGTVESINVEVSDHDEQLALERKAVREVVAKDACKKNNQAFENFSLVTIFRCELRL